MATTVKHVSRPLVSSTGTGDTVDAMSLANHLRVVVDPDDDGSRTFTVRLAEADYAGLIAEYVTGSATTILNAALDTELIAADTTDNELTSTQRDAVIGHELTLS